ncbi:MAG: hypothetical protein HY096_00430 [Nitrospinae bacterium]|nr:hypothetical protein [Nitrospinota bacterium]
MTCKECGDIIDHEGSLDGYCQGCVEEATNWTANKDMSNIKYFMSYLKLKGKIDRVFIYIQSLN